MTKEQTLAAAEVMRLSAEPGAVVQFQRPELVTEWQTIAGDPAWNWSIREYRVLLPCRTCLNLKVSTDLSEGVCPVCKPKVEERCPKCMRVECQCKTPDLREAICGIAETLRIMLDVEEPSDSRREAMQERMAEILEELK